MSRFSKKRRGWWWMCSSCDHKESDSIKFATAKIPDKKPSAVISHIPNLNDLVSSISNTISDTNFQESNFKSQNSLPTEINPWKSSINSNVLKMKELENEYKSNSILAPSNIETYQHGNLREAQYKTLDDARLLDKDYSMYHHGTMDDFRKLQAKKLREKNQYREDNYYHSDYL